jgi:hypothetical protein
MAAWPPCSWPESRRSGKDKNVDDDGFGGSACEPGTSFGSTLFPCFGGPGVPGSPPGFGRRASESRAGEGQIPKNLGGTEV